MEKLHWPLRDFHTDSAFQKLQCAKRKSDRKGKFTGRKPTAQVKLQMLSNKIEKGVRQREGLSSYQEKVGDNHINVV